MKKGLLMLPGYLIIIFFLLIEGNVSAQQSQTYEFTILTYNIYHGEDPYNRGKANIDSVAKLINTYKPDFVMLQEVDSMTNRLAGVYGQRINWMNELGKKTGMHAYFAKAISFSDGGYGEGLLSKKQLKFTTVQLPAPKGGEDRSMISVEYPLSKKKKIMVAGTHLCHEYEENRIGQLKLINESFAATGFPYILAGDLNLTPASEEYKQEIQSNWIDAALAANNAGNTFSSKEPDRRIDYVLLDKKAKWHVIAVEIIPVMYSDHMPVLVKLRLEY